MFVIVLLELKSDSQGIAHNSDKGFGVWNVLWGSKEKSVGPLADFWTVQPVVMCLVSNLYAGTVH